MATPDTPAESSVWAGPPVDTDVAPPAKRSGRRRKSKESKEATAATAAAATAAAATFDPAQPPFGAPADPVPLTQTQLPPPPPADPAGPAVWKPPVDPVTGAALWEGQAPAEAGMPELATPTKGRAKRKADKAAKAAAAASAAAMAGAVAFDAPPTADAPPAPGFFGSADPNPTTSQFDTLGGTPPPGDPGAETTSGTMKEKPPRNTRLLALLFVALLVVIGGIVYFVVKKGNNNTTTTPVTNTPGLSAAAANAALAATINLHQTDLPAGWVPASTAGQPARPPVAPAAAQTQATSALAQCLGTTTATVSGLFAGTVLPGQSGSASSPVFQDPTDATIRMYSTTRVMTTAAQAKALAAPFASASFLSCYTAYQSSLVSAAVPGSTASVQAVSLAAPAGVQTFAYLTTLTIPNQGSEIIGQAFMIGGRIESTLEPSTAGVPVPSDAFNSAYTAVSGRVGLAVNK